MTAAAHVIVPMVTTATNTQKVMLGSADGWESELDSKGALLVTQRDKNSRATGVHVFAPGQWLALHVIKAEAEPAS